MWSPSPPLLAALAQELAASVNGPGVSRDVRAEARRRLDAAREQPDLVNYLVYMLLTPGPPGPRAAAGFWLKNLIFSDWKRIPVDSVEYAKEHVLSALADPEPLVRKASSSVVTALLQQLGLLRWPELMPALMSAITSSDGAVQDGALAALRKVCEDSSAVLARDVQLTSQLVGQLISFCDSDNPRLRGSAVACLTEFVPLGSDAFLVQLDAFLSTCFRLAQTDSDPSTLLNVCRAFNEVLSCRPDALAPHLPGVVAFCAHLTKGEDEAAALEAAEVLLSLAQSDAEDETLTPLLPLFLPQLLENMVLADEDVFILESMAEDDSAEADSVQDIRPSAPRSRQKTGEDKEFEAGLDAWNLRKCSALTLDRLALKSARLTMSIALPLLLGRIAPGEAWPVRESAVLAFGAVAQGCLEQDEASFVDELVPYLCELVRSEHAPIREIACWTLSRYAAYSSDWTAFESVLQCTLDVNKRVQAAACSALATLAEAAGSALDSYAAELFQHLRRCFERYQAKNMFALYECVQTVAMACTQSLQESPVIAHPVLEPMLSRWQQVTEEDRELLALLECFSFMAVAMGQGFTEFAPPLFKRSMALVRESLILHERAQLDPGTDEPDLVIVVCALDMLDGLVQSLHAGGLAPLLVADRENQPSLVSLIEHCISLDDGDVRQSSLALLGDLAIYSFDLLLPSLPEIVPDLVQLVDPRRIAEDPEYEPTGDNAMWALAEISLHHKQFSLKPYFQDLLQRLGTVLCTPEQLSTPLLANAAAAIGRISIGLPDLVAPHLSAFIQRWLEIIVDVDPTYEKDTALQGICLAIGANPEALSEPLLVGFLKVLASYFTPTPALVLLVRELVQGYKNAFPSFDQVLESLPAMFRQQLTAQYGV